MSGMAWFAGLAIGVLVVVVAWLGAELQAARTLAHRQRIRMEEAQAWADEYQRERDALAAECDRLHSQLATLRYLYTERTREALAANYWHIAVNVARRQGGGR